MLYAFAQVLFVTLQPGFLTHLEPSARRGGGVGFDEENSSRAARLWPMTDICDHLAL